MRLQDWQLRFAAFIRARTAVPFAWGRNDCCLFAADALQAITGRDFAAGVRGAYQDARGAAALVRERGGLAEIATAALGPSVPPLMAMVGDVVLVENEGREVLAICNGTSAIAPAEAGLAVIGMDAARACWKV